jgi:hypothetical protein
MTRQTRRQFLSTSGTLVAMLGAGTTVSVAQATGGATLRARLERDL